MRHGPHPNPLPTNLRSVPGAPQASSCCCSPPTEDESLLQRLAELLRKYDVNEYAASVRVFAVKPQ